MKIKHNNTCYQERVDQLKSGVQYHHFLLESDELGGWVEERLTVCLDQDYLDFTNLQGDSSSRS